MTSLSALSISRRLAMQLLHEAQVASPNPIHGIVLSSATGVPERYATIESIPPSAAKEKIWAEVFSNPSAPAIPDSAQLKEGALTLMISLTTKGVLQMRAWTLAIGAATELPIHVND